MGERRPLPAPRLPAHLRAFAGRVSACARVSAHTCARVHPALSAERCPLRWKQSRRTERNLPPPVPLAPARPRPHPSSLPRAD